MNFPFFNAASSNISFMMKQLSGLVFLCLINLLLHAQSDRQVQWDYSAKKIADKTYELHLKAAIGGNYHMYAQDAGVEGPLPTAITFIKNPLAVIEGGTKESGKRVKKYETAWKGNVNYYEHSVDFIQVVKLKGNIKTNVAGSVEFMVCNDSQCLPPSTVNFKINVGG